MIIPMDEAQRRQAGESLLDPILAEDGRNGAGRAAPSNAADQTASAVPNRVPAGAEDSAGTEARQRRGSEHARHPSERRLRAEEMGTAGEQPAPGPPD